MTWISRLLNRSVPGVLNQDSRVISRRTRHRETSRDCRERMHEIVIAIKRHKTFFPTRIVLGYSKSSAITICASSLLNERLDSACMLNSARSTFREAFKIVPRVLMVTGGQGGYLPTEFQGLKGWRRRWIHSAITYI